MYKNRLSFLLPIIALMFISAFQNVKGQTADSFSFRSGQSMYIVAFTRTTLPIYDESGMNVTGYRDRIEFDLGAEREVRKEIEKWSYFKVADKLSESDFIFLVNIDYNSVEGLAIPLEAYNQHFKGKFDLDALREAAFGRCLAGPLKIATTGRLTERLIKDFRERVVGNSKSTK